jgi:hypothetical protein
MECCNVESPYDQEKLDKNHDDDLKSVDTLFYEKHHEEVITYSLFREIMSNKL